MRSNGFSAASVRWIAAAAALSALLIAGGCKSTGGFDRGDGSGGEGEIYGSGYGGAGNTTGIDGDGGPSGSTISRGDDPFGGSGGGAAGAPVDSIIYFGYDRSDVPSEYTELLARHARYILDSGVLDVRIEGHADERGSREYNIGLGERRAQAVRQALALYNVPVARMTTVSYGEERPAVIGHDDESWAQNRRVEIVYGRR